LFRAWINEMLAKVTAPELAADVPGAELLIQRHEEHHQEIGARNEAFAHFIATGNKLIEQVNTLYLVLPLFVILSTLTCVASLYLSWRDRLRKL
jgi:hypothetical protein